MSVFAVINKLIHLSLPHATRFLSFFLSCSHYLSSPPPLSLFLFLSLCFLLTLSFSLIVLVMLALSLSLSVTHRVSLSFLPTMLMTLCPFSLCWPRSVSKYLEFSHSACLFTSCFSYHFQPQSSIVMKTGCYLPTGKFYIRNDKLL